MGLFLSIATGRP